MIGSLIQQGLGPFRRPAAMPTTRWRAIGRRDLRTDSNHLEGDIPFGDRNAFAYPTNFKKKIARKFYNAYHIVHIVDLAEMYAATGRQVFADTARKWLGYTDHWPEMPSLAHDQISKTAQRHGDDLPAVTEKYLSSPSKRRL